MDFYIVTPTYNAAHYLNSAITSVVSQAGNFAIHYHIQDGGSADETVELLKEWEQLLKTNPPFLQCCEISFSWDSTPDGGMYDAINKGFDLLQVPDNGIMAWINTDDLYLPHAFSSAALAFRDIPDLEWIGGSMFGVYKNEMLHRAHNTQSPYPRDFIKNFLCDGDSWEHLHQAPMFWKGSLWKTAGPLNTNLKYAGDYELWTRFAQNSDFVHLPVELSIYLVRDDQLSRQSGYSDEKEKIKPLKERRIAAKEIKKFLPPSAPILTWENRKVRISHRSIAELQDKKFFFYYGRFKNFLSKIVGEVL